jgi:GMP reductase
MVKIESTPKLDFKDVLIRPKRSNLSSRSEVNLARTHIFKNKKQFNGVPIMAANMDTTGTFDVYETLRKHNINSIQKKIMSII